MTSTAQQIPANFEWNGFIQRNNNVLIDPSSPPRTLSAVQFPNQNHPATQPLVAGSLERKQKLLRSYKTNYYVVTPSKYLHEFETDDDLAKDPAPENSLYLPDCVVGALDGAKFAVKGKDVSKGKLGVNISTTHEFQFKAHTAQDAATWYQIIKSAAGQVTAELPESSVPTSPVSATTSNPQDNSLNAALADQKAQPAPVQHHTAGTFGNEKSALPTESHPSEQVPATTSTADHAPLPEKI
jgi:hypothetical protein